MNKKSPPEFNDLSYIDRMKLQAAAMVTSISNIAHADTKLAPWKFPLYFLFLSFVVAPIPIPGNNAVPLLLLAFWFGLRLTPRSRWAHQLIKEKFNPVALVEDHEDFIIPSAESPKQFQVKGYELMKHANGTAWKDFKAAGRIFVKSVRDYWVK